MRDIKRMSISVHNIYEIKDTTNVSTAATTKPDSIKTFEYTLEAPADSIVKKQLLTEDIIDTLRCTADEMGIKSYSPSLLKDDNTAIKKAQSHLIDLMKYYEGDPYYYYEAITVPYKDKFGTYTNGFGELTKNKRTQETAYSNFCKKLQNYSKEVKNLLNRRIGKNTYENLPSSIKEGLIDLNYNKGLSKISKNKVLMNAIKNKDYSTVIANLAYVYSGKSDADKVEDPGLYRRSLNRMILASRDLTGKELDEAKDAIKSCYNKAVECHKKNKKDTTELDKIYEQFTKGEISSEPKSAGSWKFTVDDSFKGKGVFAVAKKIYDSIDNTYDVTFKEFYEEFKRVNRNPESISIGSSLNVPFLKNIKSSTIEKTSSVAPIVTSDTISVQPADTIQVPKTENNETKPQKKGFWSRVWDGIKAGFAAIGNFIFNLFRSCSGPKEDKIAEVESEDLSEFKGLLSSPKTKIEQEGMFQVITYEHEVQKGDGIWRLARTFGTTEDIICKNNNIQDKNKIQLGQKLKIQKLGYKIEPGDNLFRIAKKFGLTVEILKDLNNIEDVDKINAGDIIEIPGYIYTVQPKDTLYKISKQVGVKLEDLKNINGLESDLIEPGQRIKVVYNDSDYAISADKKKVIYDDENKVTTEIVDMRGTANLQNRELLRQKHKINGMVAATREEFTPTKSGKLNNYTIIVNAGHGYSQAGTDVGTEGQKGLEDEWLINYDNAIRLKDRLCAQGAKVIFLQGHVNLIAKELGYKNNKADMFISVHVNNQDKKNWVNGQPPKDRTQVYFTGKKDNSKKLAEIMVNNFKANSDQKCAQNLPANYLVMRKAENNMNIPSVLWEVAFMCSPQGRERMNNPEVMGDYADIMTKSVIDYFKLNFRKTVQGSS